MTYLPHDYTEDLLARGYCTCGLLESNQRHRGIAPVLPSMPDVGLRRDDWDTSVIDKAIRAVAARGKRFSANDVRNLLPEVKASLIGLRFRSLIATKEIRKTNEYVPSSDKRTHGHRIAVYVPGPRPEGGRMTRGELLEAVWAERFGHSPLHERIVPTYHRKNTRYRNEHRGHELGAQRRAQSSVTPSDDSHGSR